FRMIAAISRIERFEEAEQAVAKLPRCPDWRHKDYRAEVPSAFATVGMSVSGEPPATHVCCVRPYSAHVLDSIDVEAFETPGARVKFLHDRMQPGDQPLWIVPSQGTFHYTMTHDDLDSKLNEHLAAVARFTALRRTTPQPDVVPQFDWSAIRSNGLPRGRVL